MSAGIAMQARKCLKASVRSDTPKVSAYIHAVYRPNSNILTIEQKTSKYQ